MIALKKAEARGLTDLGWLDSRHTFSKDSMAAIAGEPQIVLAGRVSGADRGEALVFDLP